MIKNLTNINLIFGLIQLGQILTSIPKELSEQISFSCVVAIIWFNWETLKVIKGQRETLTKLSYTIGLIVILFACMMVLGGFLRIVKSNNMVSGLVFLPIFEIVSGASFLYQGILSLKKDWKMKRDNSQKNSGMI